jgi:hypothetical protein
MRMSRNSRKRPEWRIVMKKIVLSLDKSVQRQLSTNHQWSAAYRAALAWYARLIVFGIDSHSDSTVVENCRQNAHPPMEKLLCRAHKEGGDVQKLFHEEYRLNARLVLRYQTLSLVVNAYRKGEKSTCHEIEVCFNQDGSISGGHQCVLEQRVSPANPLNR